MKQADLVRYSIRDLQDFRATRRLATLLSCLLLLFILPTQAATLTGTVVSIADGDTITVLDADREQHKIRIAGVDCPEKAQPFGQRSKQSMSALVFGKEVDVQWNKRDRYRRIIGKVMVAAPSCRATLCPKTLDAGLTQLTLGLAWRYRKYAKDQSSEDAGRYEFAEQEAREKRVGLWADRHPVPPWDWRKGER
ncbi:MAG: Thermonuclease precursor [Candidatus Accumulibacter regalis]|uniref:Thermonuclease n=1 Tax=Accumulibacter regalis TaxID=522306 RepID=A0A011R347_ACCRE|nr:thermonuclease family protein [Accumulibacter sp.]EXI85599.1 MAG: Thermonuclease precursor [Candidatus Accumulibacter regalis]HRE72603.1 thermonuclease family protein [Accumulibacter sp.]